MGFEKERLNELAYRYEPLLGSLGYELVQEMSALIARAHDEIFDKWQADIQLAFHLFQKKACAFETAPKTHPCNLSTPLGIYEPAGYHPRYPGDPVKSKEPDNGQAALANSLYYSGINDPGRERRIGIGAGEFVVLDRDQNAFPGQAAR
ncbi:hypothetical protein COW36_06075 [bacterium (Candidatus Blackallbacteria) CG17_big_fil_post_rev_8_21_14_2_50_48_46]|uniref:Uncharacterized protein n=1 Tax=bacterium (Candidatus Blackallbacteria) CG17_big_fil_post_rev_8_21_14_2_50_48_46 TaxID=2014261 RepID=A0A2M7G7P1_9BACT|nr:MAG: hypothetical protein COW64_16905 [bacterium (Candidatus Blackallbacteria) CG18_big_fil_WC_8_21_14_2_50_49_26]PIW18094.1 MAG: hypothetical protein COW36_06075 [bacterium (Candidatus Blackallbacteria) CG17_big_fil_post_rev_8_21_14_2_50_48_46]PIW51103.1 MAG: hypothetical protein COW20_00225 [bacterium (Candidatus Blackallbacteria) CG13_big_fil_rev_8_21_14_2_50_49_14]